ncbi:KpsF/GutQ family sugar-phosphate isomerase [Blastopirellula sp. JC732]|uniref:KpsF/GutQ family sugar-phosphate isomerase n=1 Tax=Blastopirellula sediminis TaxID=2894196 RepID=A0A9X1SG88_9BACT|nr:KpsF/GutQ family sugar-phosphate isomerase [Blastopirellula sediminis]MCC9607564.1 KpsF/GutQ family sugar-phosphate isomerase [Blastopirellula sediminis]MCC9629143.1 KpsF/GutQ family sugar-phosphate isomerase [Blastopirellula sediminis]
MDGAALRLTAETPQEEILRFGRTIIQQEASALTAIAERLDDRFCHALELVMQCPGDVIVTGMGKAGLIGQKIAATFASTGTPSHFLHPAEAIHGDLGRVDQNDVILVFSQSGETEEVVRLLPSLKSLGARIVAVTANESNTLARAAEVILPLGPIVEAGANRLAPSTSTAAMLAIGDALALTCSWQRGFRPEDFARYHPGGSLGRKLALVDEVMRPLHECRIARCDQTVRDVFVGACRPGRRTGAIMLVCSEGKLEGLFTDSDLARIFETGRTELLDHEISSVMTKSPKTVTSGVRVQAALEAIAKLKISELPVINAAGQPIGMMDITDLVELSPSNAGEEATAEKPESPWTVPFPNQNGGPA